MHTYCNSNSYTIHMRVVWDLLPEPMQPKGTWYDYVYAYYIMTTHLITTIATTVVPW